MVCAIILMSRRKLSVWFKFVCFLRRSQMQSSFNIFGLKRFGTLPFLRENENFKKFSNSVICLPQERVEFEQTDRTLQKPVRFGCQNENVRKCQKIFFFMWNERKKLTLVFGDKS